MEKLPVTKGIVQYVEQVNSNGSYFRVMSHGEAVCNIVTRNYETAEANAKLIENSINTYNSCGMLPSELKAQNEELLEALKYFVKRVDEGSIRSTKTYNYYKELIQKIESK